MFIVSKTIKGKEFIYNNSYSILCKNEEQANKLARFLNENNDTTSNDFKLKDNEIWHTYKIDRYDTRPRYELKTTKNKISIIEFEDKKGLFF